MITLHEMTGSESAKIADVIVINEIWMFMKLNKFWLTVSVLISGLLLAMASIALHGDDEVKMKTVGDNDNRHCYRDANLMADEVIDYESKDVFTDEKYLSQYDAPDSADVYRTSVNTNIKVDIVGEHTTDKDRFINHNPSIRIADAYLVCDFIHQDYSFGDVYDGKVPLVLPEYAVKEFANTEDAMTMIGQTIKLGVRVGPPPHPRNNVLPVEFILVGFSSLQNEPGRMYSDIVLMPTWAIAKEPRIGSLFEDKAFSRTIMITEFNTSKERDEFVDKHCIPDPMSRSRCEPVRTDPEFWFRY